MTDQRNPTSLSGGVQRQAYVRTINANLASALPYNPGDELSVLCECGRVECNEWIAVEHAVYRGVRGQTRRYLVSSGHERANRLVRRYPGFSVVESAAGAR
jgi:hypothetical protein